MTLTKKAKKIGNYLYWGIVGVIVFFALLATLTAFGLPSGIRLFVVVSGSMKPSILPGSVVVTKEQKVYSTGQVVTFKSDFGVDVKNPKYLITHRILRVDDKSGVPYFITKGDANENEDLKPVNSNLVLGRVLFSIPFLGYPVTFAKTQIGFILMIIIPATIIGYSEIRGIKEEILKEIRKRRKKYGEIPLLENQRVEGGSDAQ
jgi:signal peptidase